MIGATAVVQRVFDDRAEAELQVEIRGELWNARRFSPAVPLPQPGSRVSVKAVNGLVLLVESETAAAPGNPPAFNPE